MTGNLELALLTRVIDDGDFHTLEKARIDDDYFTTPIAKEVYGFLRETYHHPLTTGQVPSRDLIRDRFPAFYFAQANDSVQILAKQIREERIRIEIQTLAQELTMRAEQNPMEALATLRATASGISALAETSQDFSMASAYQMLLNSYETVANSGGIVGIPYPWAPLNDATQGMLNGQFLVFYGRPKSMKTWVGLYIAVHAYMVSRRRVLVYSREMPPELLLKRAASIMAEVDYETFKSGRLQPDLKARTFARLQQLLEDEKYAGAQGQHQPVFVVVSDRGSADGGGVSWLQAKIREIQPDLVIVDGMYLMKDDRTKSRTIDWKNITHISQDMKLTCSEFNIPLIGITQANRGAEKTNGEDLTELAFADAIGMDADAVFRVKHIKRIDPQTKRKVSEIALNAPGLRDGIFDGIVIHADPGWNFNFIRLIVPGEDPTQGGQGQGGGGGAPASPADGGMRPRPRLQPKVFTNSGNYRDPLIPIR